MRQDVARAASYMTKFRCLGGDCEDTCCQGWTVPIDEPTHRRLEVLAERDPISEQMLARGIELTPQGPYFGKLRFDETGRCGMLDQQGLCAVHARLGPEALFDVCMTYPRYYSEVDGELELFGTLSCPEVARLCLLGEDALALTALPAHDAPRKLRNQFRTERPYYQPFVSVRSAFSELLAWPRHGLAEKLFALLWISDKLSPVLHVGVTSVPVAEVSKALTAMLAPAALDTLAGSYRSLGLDGSLAISVLSNVLDAKQDWPGYCELRERVAPETRARVDACLTRYAQNHLYTTPYMLYPSLFAYARDLTWRVAMLRYLLHQDLSAFAGDSAAVDRRIVEVVYKFGRRVEHSELFTQLGELLATQQLDSFAHTVCFLPV